MKTVLTPAEFDELSDLAKFPRLPFGKTHRSLRQRRADSKETTLSAAPGHSRPDQRPSEPATPTLPVAA
jgi:hypothetical protein